MDEKKFYKVVKEDLTHLGGPMGTEYTITLKVKFYKSREAAVRWVEKDYGEPLPEPYLDNEELIRWDCRTVGYTIYYPD